jgi:hypothetical protein
MLASYEGLFAMMLVGYSSGRKKYLNHVIGSLSFNRKYI